MLNLEELAGGRAGAGSRRRGAVAAARRRDRSVAFPPGFGEPADAVLLGCSQRGGLLLGEPDTVEPAGLARGAPCTVRRSGCGAPGDRLRPVLGRRLDGGLARTLADVVLAGRVGNRVPERAVHRLARSAPARRRSCRLAPSYPDVPVLVTGADTSVHTPSEESRAVAALFPPRATSSSSAATTYRRSSSHASLA